MQRQNLSSSRFLNHKSYLQNDKLRTEASPPSTLLNSNNSNKTPLLQKRQQTEPSPNSFLSSKNQLTNQQQQTQKSSQNQSRPNSSGNSNSYLSKIVNLQSFHQKNGQSQQSNPSNSQKIKQHINSITSNASTQADYIQSKKSSNGFNNITKNNSGVNNSNGSIGSQSSQFDVYYQTKKNIGQSQHPIKQINLLSSGKKKKKQNSCDQKQNSNSTDSRKNQMSVQNMPVSNFYSQQSSKTTENNNKINTQKKSNDNKEQVLKNQSNYQTLLKNNDNTKQNILNNAQNNYTKSPQINKGNIQETDKNKDLSYKQNKNMENNIQKGKQLGEIMCVNHQNVKGEYIVYNENQNEKTYCCHQCTVEGAFQGKKILEISEKNINQLNLQYQLQQQQNKNPQSTNQLQQQTSIQQKRNSTVDIISPEPKSFASKIQSDKRKQQLKQQQQSSNNTVNGQNQYKPVEQNEQQLKLLKEQQQQKQNLSSMSYGQLLQINDIQLNNLSENKKLRSDQIQDFINNLQNVQNNCQQHLQRIQRIQEQDKLQVDQQISEITDLYSQIRNTLDLEKEKAIQRVIEIQDRVKFDQEKTSKKYKQGEIELNKIKNDIFQNFQNILNNMEERFFNTIIAKYKENITQYKQTPEQISVPRVLINLQNKQQIPKFQNEFKMALGSLMMIQQVNPSLQVNQFQQQQQQNQQQQNNNIQIINENEIQQNNKNKALDRRQQPMYISFDGRQENKNMFSTNNNNNNNNNNYNNNYNNMQESQVNNKFTEKMSPVKNQQQKTDQEISDQLQPISHQKPNDKIQKSPNLLNKFESSYVPQYQQQLQEQEISQNNTTSSPSKLSEPFILVKEGEEKNEYLQKKFNEQFKINNQNPEKNNQIFKSNTETENDTENAIKYINNFQSPQTNITKDSLRSSKLIRSPQNAKYLDFLDKVNNTQNKKQQYYTNIFKEHPILSPATQKQQPKFQPMSVNTQILKDKSNYLDNNRNKTQQSLQFGNYLMEKEKQGSIANITDTMKKDYQQSNQFNLTEGSLPLHVKQPSFQKQLFSNSPNFKN